MVNFALENSREKVWKKEILSMTVKELYEAREKARRQVEELRASLRKHRAQLAALGPLIRAEEERPGGYVSQHVRPLHGGPPPAGPAAQGVRDRPRLGGDPGVRQHGGGGQRLQGGRRAEHGEAPAGDPSEAAGARDRGPCGPRSVPTRLFDERGEAVSSPALLRNEQAVWVSYGEDYRWGSAGGLAAGVLPLLAPPRPAIAALSLARLPPVPL
ncbi:hypothetical protein ANANG_G00210100 [Anguilla anguilla]|uniref:Doublecortin domain-containing protein n=1 Tax=Anguilla anguilla TaxID=7936 RepID=A0A9D3RUD8_ANGAN|nr:hypothetical protein ANANG_G00210100 [Anguilla anguilla]